MRISKRSIGYLFFLITILLFVFNCQEQKNLLPESFSGFTLHKTLSGEEAKSFVDKLHSQSVAPEKNEIGFYKGEHGTAAIYITYYSDEKTAREEGEKMTEKISPENSVFVEGAYLELFGKNIYRCFGMGQTHFVFSEGKQLYWLSVETINAKKYLEDYLNFIK